MMIKTSQALLTLLVLLLILVSKPAWPNSNGVSIHITETGTDKFEVVYTLDRPVRSLQFLATPDTSRVDFWRAKSDEFELTHHKERDAIKRTDSQPFQTVVFVVDIVDISLPNYYRPFSPLLKREDGLIIHSGQYFVCANNCSDTATWQVNVTAKNKNIVHYQGSSISAASWQDSGDGRSFYVGPLSIEESDSLVAIIDSGLPTKLKGILNTNLPKVVSRLATKFEAPQTKSLVFATYNKGDPERFGFQGGVLNQTVFMHWWGLNLEQRVNENDELWFLAHEISHFYQHKGGKVDVDEVAWIHEGFAELMAANLLASNNERLKDYVQHRFNSAKTDCAAGLELTPVGQATRLKKFDLHYKCGILLHRFITQNAIQKITVFELWNRYRAAINKGMPPSKKTYLDIVKLILSEDDFLIIQTTVGSELAPNSVVKEMLENSIF